MMDRTDSWIFVKLHYIIMMSKEIFELFTGIDLVCQHYHRNYTTKNPVVSLGKFGTTTMTFNESQ
jgi:hypothetical protein